MPDFVQTITDFIGSSSNDTLNYVVFSVFGIFLLKEVCSFLGSICSSLGFRK